MNKLLIISVVCTVVLSACTKDLGGLNVNTKAASSVPSTTLFTYAEKQLVDNYTSIGVGTAPFRVLSQEWTENTYIYEAQYNFSAYNANAGWWNALYRNVLANLQAAKNSYPKDIKDPAILRNDLIISDILEVYAYNLLVNTYGNIPYTEALNSTIPYPKYDDAKTVFMDLLTRLDTCIAGLNPSAKSLGVADQIYNGNITEWQKFAATLKLKMAMIIADVDPATASQKALEAVTTGVFTSNADNATMTYDQSSPGNSNPLWQALVNSGRHDFVPTNLLVNTMDSLHDPRVPLYFTQDPNGSYSGGIPGGGNGYGIYSDFSAQMQTPSYPGVLLTYTQSEFLQAEAIERGIAVGGTAQSHYNNAITASITFWEVVPLMQPHI